MIANHRGEVPFLVLLLPFLAGTGLGIYFAIRMVLLWGVWLAAVLLFTALNLGYSKLNLYKNQWIGGSLILLILLLSGWLRSVQSNELRSANHFSHIRARKLVVRISDEPEQKNGFLRFTGTVIQAETHGDQLAASGTLLVRLKDSSRKLEYGDELLIPASYKPVDPPFNPAEFNYKSYLANKNIYYQEFLYPGQFRLLRAGAGNRLIAFALRFRRQLLDKLKENIPDTNSRAVASALILGYKADLSGDVRRTYADTGTIHVLSVSGAHVAAIFGLLSLVLIFFDRFRYGKAAKTIIIIALLWCYAMLTGFSPSVCRAVTMITIVIAGKTIRRQSNTLNTLAASAFLMLLYNPLYIADVGFQLSYLAVFGLAVFQPIIYRWFSFKPKWASKLWLVCSVSIAAQLTLFPLSAFYFHQFPVYFLIGNLIIFIPVLIIIYTGIALLFLPRIAIISKILAFILEKSIQLMTEALAFIEHIPHATLRKIWLSTTEYLLFYALIISIFYYIHQKKKQWLWLSLATVLLLSVGYSIKKTALLRSNKIVWLNLGKHRGVIFRHGLQAVVLTDLESDDQIYQYSIQPYLDSCGVQHTAIYHPGDFINTRWIEKKYGLIQFFSIRIFIFDKGQNNYLPDRKIKVDYIYLSGNPGYKGAFLPENIYGGQVIMDGTNDDKYISNRIEQLKKYHVNYYALKRNKSLISISN